MLHEALWQKNGTFTVYHSHIGHLSSEIASPIFVRGQVLGEILLAIVHFSDNSIVTFICGVSPTGFAAHRLWIG